jgi:hypothetical protein
MNNKITINGYDILKTQIGSTEFRISVLSAEKTEYSFNVSLQPTGRDDVLPTYQLSDKSQIIPLWIKENLNVISDWITKGTK